METISLQISDDLAGRLLPLKDRLPEIIELGLRHWSEQEPAPLSPREQAEKLWEAAGLVVMREPGAIYDIASPRGQAAAIHVGDKPDGAPHAAPEHVLSVLQSLILELHALDRELARYEAQYGMLSETFFAWYQSGEEPDDPAWVQDFALWAGAYQLKLRRQDKYRRLVAESLARQAALRPVRPALPVGAPA